MQGTRMAEATNLSRHSTSYTKIGLWDHVVEHVSINLKKKIYQGCHKHLEDLDAKGTLKALDKDTLTVQVHFLP